ncbi:MAG: DEAD/DEAH box helicase family protein [Dethiobacter sp.]|nr:DEAD/DEAH box helicase family protein [Dethiobacter sp.]
MSLIDVDVRNEYRSLLHDITKDFYIPLLSQATEYRRAVGFFSSTVLCQISDGIAALAKNDGKIKIVASPHLSDDDIKAIRKGYELRDIVKKAVMREMREPSDAFAEKRLNLLANLIAEGILDIKIAFTESGSAMGMYHEKLGIISDSNGNAVVFSGSMNESANALTANYEVVDVWCSWKGEEQNERVKFKKAAFSSIWNDTEPNVKIIYFPELKQEIIDRYRRTSSVDYGEALRNELEQPIPTLLTSRRRGAAIPTDVKLHEYQLDAINAWEEKGFRGIFDMATGTGKTYTGLGAIVRLCEVTQNKLAVFVVCPFQHLVEQWVEDIERFNIKPIIGYSASPQKDWLKRLENAIRDQKLKIKGREFFCFVCTNATFSTAKVQTMLEKLRGNAMLLVDEAHNFGAARLSRLMSECYNYRLALSATIDRHNDESGTRNLYDYFGEKCIEYPLERAIEEKKLTRYKYYPIITTLNDNESRLYTELTIEIGKCLVKGNDGRTTLSEKGKRIALKRARLVAGIEDKLTKLRDCIQPYVNDTHLLVYCGATTVLQDNRDRSETSDDDIRQIDAVTRLLGNSLNMRVSQFTSKEDITEREVLKREFAAGDNLQALIAIKCLDEGVNIPAIKTAFILASTTNPKEYIQRRGRVLRLYKGKEYAVIYDFIALPRPLDEVSSITDEQLNRELSLIKNELARAEEFARIAMNMGEAERVIGKIKEAYSINDYAITYEEEFDYGD